MWMTPMTNSCPWTYTWRDSTYIYFIVRADLTHFYMYLDVQYVFGRAKICTNDYFDPNSFSA